METLNDLLNNKDIKKIVHYFAGTNRRILGYHDAKQEAYICLINAYNSYNPAKNLPFKAWFFRVAFNKFATFRRQYENYVAYKEKVKPLQKIQYEQPVENTTGLFEHECLTEKEKKLLYWRFAESKSLEEIGSHFGVTKECIRKTIKKSLIKLKSSLNKNSYNYF